MESIRWPNGAKCAVMISYDVDGRTLFRNHPAKGWMYPRSRSYGAYGPQRGVYHIIDMLKRQEIPCTFFVPARTAVDYPEMFKYIDACGYEVGCHGFDHELFSGRTYQEQSDIIDRSQQAFYELIGKRARVFRTPSGDFTKDTPRLLRDKGFIGSSSMRGDDIPYRTLIDGEASDLIEMPAKWEMDDYPQFGSEFFPVETLRQTRMASYDLVLDNWKREFDGYYREHAMYILMMHPQVSGRPARVDMVEELIAYIKGHGDVWFATAGEIAQWWRQND